MGLLRRTLRCLLPAVAAAALIGGCGDDESTTSSSASSSSSSTSSTTSTTSSTSSTSPPAIQNDLGPRPYRQALSQTFQLLSTYWNGELPKLNAEPSDPDALVSYWNRRTDPGCAGHPDGPQNAEYCSDGNSIAWDGNWLYGTFYRRIGEPSVAFVLAHEYGHLVQDRIGTFDKYPLSIEKELNADCLAGAWFGEVNQDIARLTRADYESIYDGVLDVADPRGLPWQNPQAHGTASQRDKAISIGLKGGPEACIKELAPGFIKRG